jgi:hypothetical protein
MIILITFHHYKNKIQLLCPVLTVSILPSDLVTKAVSTLFERSFGLPIMQLCIPISSSINHLTMNAFCPPVSETVCTQNISCPFLKLVSAYLSLPTNAESVAHQKDFLVDSRTRLFMHQALIGPM